MSLIAIVDLGSTSVGGALLMPNHEKATRGKSRWRVVYTTRRRIEFSEQLESEMFFSQMLAALKLVLQDFSGAARSEAAKRNRFHAWGSISPKEIHCFLSAPFYAGQTRVVRHDTAKPQKINEKLVADLIGGELKRFETEHAGQHQLIENRLLSIKLNGYEVSKPYQQVAQEIELTNYFSLGSTKILAKIREIISGAFHHRRIHFHTMAHSSYQVWQQIMPGRNSHLFFDIGGEVTELTVVSRGHLRDTISFPLGENQVVRQVSKVMKTTLAEAYAALKREVLGEHQALTSAALAKVLTQAKVEWLGATRQALAQSGNACFLPSQAWLVGDQNLVMLFGGWLTGQNLETVPMTNSQMAVDYWRADWFLPWCEHDAAARQDLSLMTETIYYDRIVTT